MSLGTLRVGSKRAGSDFGLEGGEVIVNIDRPNILGNPYVKSERRNRQQAIEEFRVDLEREIKRRSGLRYDAVCKIAEHVLAGSDVVLLCWCHPLACHGDVIKEIVERLLKL
jgi:hypothetical protein